MSELPKHACISCGRRTIKYSKFKCPKCNDSVICRCYTCREKYISYKCTKCTYEGP